MLELTLPDECELAYDVDLGDGGHLNLSFLATNQRDEVLHLSIRPDEARLLANDCHDGTWGAERSAPLPAGLPAGRCPVTLRFDAAHAQIGLDGQTVLRLEQSRFSPGDIRFLVGAAPCQGHLWLDGQRLDLPVYRPRIELWDNYVLAVTDLPDRIDPGAIDIRGGDGTALAWQWARVRDPQGRPATRVLALLPGRLWRDLPAGSDTLQVAARVQGRDLPLEIGAQDVLRIAELVAGWNDAALNAFATIAALEHLAYGRLFDRLTPAAQGYYHAAAGLFGVATALPLPPAPQEPALPARPFAPSAAHGRLLAEIGWRVRQDPTADPVAPLLREIEARTLDPQAVTALSVALADHFCHIDRFESLYAVWARHGDGVPLRGEDLWALSAALPFEIMQGPPEAIGMAMDRILARQRAVPGEWINTAPLAWALRRCFSERHLPQTALSRPIETFLALLEDLAQMSAEQLHSQDLAATAALLVTQRGRLLPTHRPAVVESCLAIYGLSPTFWAHLDRADPPVDAITPRLARARADWLALRAAFSAPEAPAGLDALVARLGHGDHPDRRRLRRETDAWLRQTAGRSPEASARQSDTDSLLRRLAAPGAAPLEPAQAPVARRAVQALCPTHDPEDRYERTRDLVRLAQQVSPASDGAGQVDREALDRLCHRLAGLCTPAADFAGIGIALAVLTALGERAPRDIEARAPLCGLLETALQALAAEQAARPADTPGPLDRLRTASWAFSTFARFDRAATPNLEVLRARLGDLLDPERPRLPETQALTGEAPPLFDALVMICSCRAHLQTRIPALRRTWLPRLRALGIPHVIVVGGGDDRLDNDVLHLDAPDDYEGLPLKSLAMLRWAHRHSHAAHVIKIDDDCYLDVPAFFEGLDYRRADYYGRGLLRQPGDKLRDWHVARSKTPRGRFELDKSPEPSRYADGGAGYTLSRRALRLLEDAADSAPGQQLILGSFCEDALIGDLLALQGITVNSDNYFTAVLRRTHPGGRPVMRWDNTFFPGAVSGIKLAHLDSADTLDTREAQAAETTLHPRKLWPSNGPVKLGFESRALEVISPDAKVQALAKAPVSVVAVMRNEMFMLPLFLAHYRRLGVESFLIADNCSDDGTLEYLEAQPDVALFCTDTSFRAAAQGTDWKIALMAQLRMNRWSLVADSDELLLYPRHESLSLADFLARDRFAHTDAFRVLMLDMYPEGPLSAVDFASGDPFAEAGFLDRETLRGVTLGRGAFSESATMTSGLRHRLLTGARPDMFVSEKVPLLRYRPWMRLSVSLHYATGVALADLDLLFAHFKYNAEFHAKARREIARGQYFDNAAEYRRYLDLLATGSDVFYDPGISVPWREAGVVRRVLGTS